MAKMQWFKVSQGGATYSEIALVEREDTQFCYLKNGKKISIADKCNRGDYPLRPTFVKWKGI